jgi:hypothetical protein
MIKELLFSLIKFILAASNLSAEIDALFNKLSSKTPEDPTIT